MSLRLTILLFFALFSSSAQQPDFTWGSPINRNPRLLQHMEVVGVDKDGFFATHATDNQTVLEHFNPQNDRLWTTVLLPRSPEGAATKFHSVQMIKGKLYLISSGLKDGQTLVYAQEIRHNGNYDPEIVTLARGKYGKKIHIATAQDEAALIVVLSGDNQQTITSALLTNKLEPRWTQTLTSGGDMQEVLVNSDGTAYLLTKSLPAAPSTSAFFLYRLKAKSGRYREVALGDSDYRPLKAKITASPSGETIVTGYIIPSSYVASQNPEPIGTFYYRFQNGKLDDPVVAFSPFREDFIQSYKSFKPDYDSSQRLRYLELDRVVPMDDGGVILIGEVNFKLDQGNTRLQHNNDVVIVRLHKDGSQAYICSTNKLQATTSENELMHSYFATSIDDTLKIIYLYFEYAGTAGGAPAGKLRSTPKTTVLVTVAPDGSKEILPLEGTHQQEAEDFYISPKSAYQISPKDFIILGVGPDYYKYGRMRFN
ncbi:hypothetical protein ACSX1A_01330 [Pontibacter sp. MBLB2868]|uniref:hypothetical protein n=1 Tax=Pontibacter sp. MBLB2868 TaxID=3451555 RepID=UPI003F754CE2